MRDGKGPAMSNDDPFTSNDSIPAEENIAMGEDVAGDPDRHRLSVRPWGMTDEASKDIDSQKRSQNPAARRQGDPFETGMILEKWHSRSSALRGLSGEKKAALRLPFR